MSDLNAKEIKVAAIQFDVKSDDKEANLLKAIQLLEAAGREGVNIASLPMGFLTGVPVTREIVRETAEPIPGPMTSRLGEVADRHGMYIVGGTLFEKENGEFYNTSPLVGPNGTLLGKQRCTHIGIYPPDDEVSAGVSAGTEYPVFRTGLGTIGILCGGDIDFVEVPRILALQGAEIIFWLTQVDYQWLDICRVLEMANAFFNCVYFVVSNRTGVSAGTSYYGESKVINPFGRVISSAGQSTETPEGMAIAPLDMELLRKMRKDDAALLNRRKPETYSLLCGKKS